MDDNSTDPQQRASVRIWLPGSAIFFFISSGILLVLGFLTFMGSSTREYFAGAPFQATLGLVFFLTGIGMFLSALVLVGARSIAQQQLDALRRELR